MGEAFFRRRPSLAIFIQHRDYQTFGMVADIGPVNRIKLQLLSKHATEYLFVIITFEWGVPTQ